MRLLLVAIVVVALSACSEDLQEGRATTETTTAQLPPKAESEAYMRKAEEDWAQVFVKDNPELFNRILADDFVGVFSDGVVRNKAQTIPHEKPDPAFVSAKLDYVNYRHFGDMVVAQGVESAQRRDGAPDLRLIWTDVWRYRDGRWQIVASHVSRLPQPKR
jgi:hypothetical protein